MSASEQNLGILIVFGPNEARSYNPFSKILSRRVAILCEKLRKSSRDDFSQQKEFGFGIVPSGISGSVFSVI
jgi:hypothetical protein